MIAETPHWPHWWEVADTRVKLSRCIALSLNINPHLFTDFRLFDSRSSFFHRMGLQCADLDNVDLYRRRLKILTAYRQDGDCFSADTPGGDERSVMLREFARFASQRFTEPSIPKELAVLAAIGNRPLPAPEVLANMVTAGHSQSADVDPGEKVAIAKATKGKYLSIKEQQYGSILQAIRDLKLDPKRLPKGEEIKRQVWNMCERPGYQRTAFDKRWQELRGLGEIGD